MTKKQYQALASDLLGTRANVYQMVRAKFGLSFTDANFDKLKKHGGIFRCEECSEWKDLSERDPGMHMDRCCECGEMGE